jgi:hypothetical protein
MNKVVLQLWEESEKNWGIRPDGCSIHLDDNLRNSYVKALYVDRGTEIPNIYERILGDPIIAFVNDNIYAILENEGSVRLLEHEMNNLINLEEIIINND